MKLLRRATAALTRPRRAGRRAARALAADRVRDGATELSLYRHDASHMEGAAVAVCFPTSTAEVAGVRPHRRSRHGVPFVARGSGTGLAGGAVPPEGAVVISTTKMNRVAVGRPRRPPGVGRARACSTST